LLVASSSINNRGLVKSARAIPIRCLWPPLNLVPRSPTCVLTPSGSRLIRSLSCAFSKASLTKRSVNSLSSKPRVTFSRIVPLTIVIFCGTYATAPGQVWIASLGLFPDIKIFPPLSSSIPSRTSTSEVFPAPEGPDHRQRLSFA
jgi:hypothetical protein